MQKNTEEPAEYKRGYAMFLGCKIDLSKRPLIPRPETEFWAGRAIKELSGKPGFPHPAWKARLSTCCLDMFAGSGCIGIAVLKHVKNAKVDFSDTDNRAVGVEIIKSDVFNNIRGRYDYIFANPPYIPEKNKGMVQKSVLDFEPHKALFAGKDGLLYIRKFLGRAKNYLLPGGAIYMEFDPPEREEIQKLLKKYKYKKWRFHKDQYGKLRYVVIK